MKAMSFKCFGCLYYLGVFKSTLLHILACIDIYEIGKYYIDDTLKKLKREKTC